MKTTAIAIQSGGYTGVGFPCPLTGWAVAEAGSLLDALSKKWAHTLEVADRARWAQAEPLVDLGFHPLDGARYLRRRGLGELACLVTHHPGAHIEAGHRGLAAELAEFGRPTGPVPDALTSSDVTSGPTGEAVDPGDRFEEIVDRHGHDSVVARRSWSSACTRC